MAQELVEELHILQLDCKVQHYEWGRRGEQSQVAQLHSLASGTEVDKNLPYAELWMGTHDSGPSLVRLGDSQIPLKKWLLEHPNALGQHVLERWNGELPFLFKVLSVAKALSIQAHPDKNMAEQLHRQQPKVYKDANHKPEMALALSEFGALCGFVSPQELTNALETVPELVDVLNQEVVDHLLLLAGSSDRAVLREAFTSLMTLEQSVVSDAVSKLVGRLASKSKLTGKEELVLSLEKQYPGDVGVLSAFFLNYIRLAPGQAVFLDANEPHAYLYGECIECMATSDNVVRAGLTPKLRDTQTLCSMLTYKQGMPELVDGCYVDSFTRRYSTPSDEFEVDHITVPVGESMKITTPCGPSIFLVYRGVGIVTETSDRSSIVACLARGTTFFLSAGKELDLSAVTEADAEKHPHNSLQLYRAGVSSRFMGT